MWPILQMHKRVQSRRMPPKGGHPGAGQGSPVASPHTYPEKTGLDWTPQSLLPAGQGSTQMPPGPSPAQAVKVITTLP